MLDVHRILKEKGLNRAKLAELLGKGDNRSYVTNILNGKPNLETLEKIADVLGVELSDLFTRKNETPIYIKEKDGTEKVVGYLKK